MKILQDTLEMRAHTCSVHTQLGTAEGLSYRKLFVFEANAHYVSGEWEETCLEGVSRDGKLQSHKLKNMDNSRSMAPADEKYRPSLLANAVFLGLACIRPEKSSMKGQLSPNVLRGVSRLASRV